MFTLTFFKTLCKRNKIPLTTSDLEHSTPTLQWTPVALFPTQHPFPDLITELLLPEENPFHVVLSEVRAHNPLQSSAGPFF